MTNLNDTTAMSTVTGDTLVGSSGLTWPDRIANYHKEIGRSAFMSYEDGWAYGVWFLGNSWAVRSGYYGGYPQGYLNDAHSLAGVPIEDYDLILADPPYNAEDADHYGTPLVSRNKVVEVLSHRMQPGAHLGWLDQAQPMYAKARLKPEAAIGIVRSTMHRYRCLLIWRRI